MLKILAFLTALLAYGFVQTTNAAPRVPEIVAENGLTYCTHSTGFSFNPQTADAGTSMNVVTEQIYNKLFEIKENSSKIEPSLAKSYNFSDDGKTLIIELRKGVKFHHTSWFTPTRNLNADDVVFSLNRVLGHSTALPEFATSTETERNPQYQIFNELARKSRFPYFESVKLNQKIKSVETLYPYRVKIELFAPDSSVLSHLASQYAVILSQEYALQLNADDNLTQLDQLPVGTGAYQVKNAFRSQYVRLEKNPHYWQKIATIPNVVIDFSTDRTGRLAKFFNKECHITASPELSLLELVRIRESGVQINLVDGMNLSFIAFNFLSPTMQDMEIRRAIAQAINRQRIIEHIYYDTATLANKIIPSVSWASSDEVGNFAYDYNPEQAKQKLVNKKLRLTIWVIDEEQMYNPAPLKMAEMIKFDLANAGVVVKVRSISRQFLNQNLNDKTEDYDLILSGWLTGSLDPDSFMRPILSCNTYNEVTNLANWCSPSFDNLLDLTLMKNDSRQRAADYNMAQQQVLSELPILPIANVSRVLISDNRVKGIEMTPFGNIHFEKLYFAKKEKMNPPKKGEKK